MDGVPVPAVPRRERALRTALSVAEKVVSSSWKTRCAGNQFRESDVAHRDRKVGTNARQEDRHAGAFRLLEEVFSSH